MSDQVAPHYIIHLVVCAIKKFFGSQKLISISTNSKKVKQNKANNDKSKSKALINLFHR